MSDSDNEKNDLEFTRQTYYDLIQKGQESLDEMMNIASALEHPRAFEVVAGLIKNVSEVNDKLIDLHKKKNELSRNTQALEGGTTNNLFVGSTVELQRMLQDIKEPEAINIKDNENVIEFNPKSEDD
ncbi:MAG: terminase [Euryarchaeota archaeon]|nr:terminase [Euryarchaeota archaeon]|tara:strand:+ start:4228 stop:4608 length:381 start_codon:yes stop_codon:yes gene_type:complete